jgi:hypothetical protein
VKIVRLAKPDHFRTLSDILAIDLFFVGLASAASVLGSESVLKMLSE